MLLLLLLLPLLLPLPLPLALPLPLPLPLLLPVWQRVNYKIATLVHRSLSGQVPSYLADDCRLVTDAGVRRLRSADTRTLVIGRTQSSFGDRTFSAAAPRPWNSLLSDIRQPDLSQ